MRSNPRYEFFSPIDLTCRIEVRFSLGQEMRYEIDFD